MVTDTPHTPDVVGTNALLVRDGVLSRITLEERDGDSCGAHMHALIGGWFSSAFGLPGNSIGRQLVGLCDDEGLLKPLPWNVMLDDSVYPGRWPICGPLVIHGAVLPETASMTELELSAFHILPASSFLFQGATITLPVLVFRPGYDRGRD